MHLLLAQRGTIADEGEAIDLGQAPADICVLSAADTELAGNGRCMQWSGATIGD